MNFDLGDLCRPKDYAGQPVKFAQVKADGLRAVVFKFDAEDIQVWTRNGLSNLWTKLTSIPKIADAVRSLPDETILDCELHCPGVQATDVKTLLNNADQRLQLTPFAVPWLAGKDFRSATWDAVEMAIWETGLKPPQTIALPGGKLSEVALQTLHEQTVAQKLEGWVLKQRHYDGWFKLKPVKSVDCIVVDTKKSDSLTYYGGLKAIIVAVKRGTKLVEIASVGSGFDAEFRMNCDPKKLVGRVCEVSYDSLAGKGKLKFPRFVRWRDDKPAHECTYDQLEK